MAAIALHHDKDVSATYVSNSFIDYYMTAANGEYVKIYLYLLRCMSNPENSFSLSAAADRFEHTEKDIQRALKYWEKMNLLQLEYDGEKNLSGIRFLDSLPPRESDAAAGNRSDAPLQAAVSRSLNGLGPDQAASVGIEDDGFLQAAASGVSDDGAPQALDHLPPETVPSDTEQDGTARKRPDYTAAQIAEFQAQDSVSELLFVSEHYLKRPLTTTDIHTIFFWYDDLKLKVDLIEYLIEYCIGKGHTSLRYMDKVAIAWKEEGIQTVAQAKQASSSFSQLHFSVMKALGISGRNLVASETALIDKWSKQYGFTADIIAEACRRTISSTHQPSFEYTDRILGKWHKQKVRHLNDIARLDSDFQKTRTAAALSNRAAAPNRFHNFTQRTYDYEKLEQQLLSSPNAR